MSSEEIYSSEVVALTSQLLTCWIRIHICGRCNLDYRYCTGTRSISSRQLFYREL